MNLFHNRSSYLRPTKLSVHGSGNNVNNFAIQKTFFFFKQGFEFSCILGNLNWIMNLHIIHTKRYNHWILFLFQMVELRTNFPKTQKLECRKATWFHLFCPLNSDFRQRKLFVLSNFKRSKLTTKYLEIMLPLKMNIAS